MRHTTERHTDAADRMVKDIRRKTRKRYSSEDKIRIVLAGLRGKYTIAELFEGVHGVFERKIPTVRRQTLLCPCRSGGSAGQAYDRQYYRQGTPLFKRRKRGGAWLMVSAFQKAEERLKSTA